MSLYIHDENQEILWRLFDKLPYIIKNSYNPNLLKYKEILFKETIEYFYEENKTKQLSVFELEQLNKDTLIYINEKLVKTYYIPVKAESNESTSFSNIISVSKTETVSTEYIPYKDKPNTLNPFSETIEDEPISNMDELIEIYKKQRIADEPLLNVINPN
jgi:hypothetical protein